MPKSEPEWLMELVRPETSSFGIGQVRAIIERSFLAEARLKIIVLCQAELLTEPAQHALLKLLEEPLPNHWYVLLTASSESLKSTIVSRCTILPRTASSLVPVSPRAEELLKQLLADQQPYSYWITISQEFQDRAQAISLIDQLTKLSYERLPDQADSIVAWLTRLQVARARLERNANVRLVLEQCFFG